MAVGVSGVVATFINDTIMTPLDVVKQRLQVVPTGQWLHLPQIRWWRMQATACTGFSCNQGSASQTVQLPVSSGCCLTECFMLSPAIIAHPLIPCSLKLHASHVRYHAQAAWHISEVGCCAGVADPLPRHAGLHHPYAAPRGARRFLQGLHNHGAASWYPRSCWLPGARLC